MSISAIACVCLALSDCLSLFALSHGKRMDGWIDRWMDEYMVGCHHDVVKFIPIFANLNLLW